MTAFFWKVIKKYICSTVSITILHFTPICCFYQPTVVNMWTLCTCLSPRPRSSVIDNFSYIHIHFSTRLRLMQPFHFDEVRRRKWREWKKIVHDILMLLFFCVDPFYICTGLSSLLNEMKNRYEYNFLFYFFFHFISRSKMWLSIWHIFILSAIEWMKRKYLVIQWLMSVMARNVWVCIHASSWVRQ